MIENKHIRNGGDTVRAGLRENDKILRINKRTPRDVNDAVSIIKKAGKEMVLTVGRRDQPDVVGQGKSYRKKEDIKSNQIYLLSHRDIQTMFILLHIYAY